MRRQYLEQLGHTSTRDLKDSSRDLKWEQEREQYGFDSRDTWDLNSTMTEILYERLKMYLKEADGRIFIRDEKLVDIFDMIYSAETFLSPIASEEERTEANNNLWELWNKNKGRLWW